jgi:hypothetical protein
MMPSTHFTITGLEDAEKRLAKAIAGIEGNTREGIRESAIIVKETAQELTSIDTGDLIGSAFYRTGFLDSRKTKPVALIGYKEDYAAAVHEMPENTNWQKIGAENKFLEKGLVRNITKIYNTLKRFASRNP